MFSGIPGLSPLDASGTSYLSCDSQKDPWMLPDAKRLLREQNVCLLRTMVFFFFFFALSYMVKHNIYLIKIKKKKKEKKRKKEKCCFFFFFFKDRELFNQEVEITG